MKHIKQWLCALLAPVLALCLLPLPAARAATAAELQAAAYSAYYDFLQAEISRIGIISNCEQYFKDHMYDSILDERPKGLLYAQLIDFDNSGVDELLIVKVDEDDEFDLTDVLLQVYAYAGGKAVKVAEPYISDGGYPRFEFTLTTGTNGHTYLKEHSSSTLSDTYRYYSISNGQWVQAHSIGTFFHPDIYISIDVHTSTGEYTYNIEGKDVSYNQYRAQKDSLEHTTATYAESTLYSEYTGLIYSVLPSGTVTSVMNTLRPYASQDTLIYYTPPASWAAEQVNAAIADGIVPASLQNSYPKAITRAEFCALAVNFYEKHTGTTIPQTASFSDTSDANVRKMASIGVVNGIGGDKFAPNQPITREQAAVILGNLASAMDNPIPASAPTFADNAKIAGWASAQVGQMQASGIMGGVGSNQFNPQGSYTREQSIVTIMRMENRVIPVSSVTLNQTEATLMAGDTLNLTATFAPENATNKAITWSTSNKNVASVDQNGVVTGQGRGTAVISATAASGASAKCTITGQDENTVEITSDLPVTVDCLAFPRGEVPELSEDFDYRPSDSIVAGTITITDFRVADKFVTYDGVEGTRGVTFTYRLDAKDEQIGDQFYPYLRWQVKDEDGRVVDSGLDRDTCAEYMEPGETDTITISIAGMEAGKSYTVEFVSDTGKELEDVASDEPELRVTGLPITSSLDADDGVTSVTVHSVDMTTEYRPMYNDFRCELTFHCSGVYFYSPRWPRVEWELTDSSGAVVGSGSIYVTSWTLEDDGTFLETETLTLEGGETYTLSFSTTVR